ncbi:MAG: DMT family transporter [Gammaproteobacteria bacterium]|jgi:drug/metabolite transporter (DMT)-like permease|nr:DMT family transporter [Gammaproteobacteria bacterium]
MVTLEQARLNYRRKSVRWGFYWAMWCALLWGAWYVPGTAVWYEEPFVSLGNGGTIEFLVAAAIITSFSAVGVLIALFVWLLALGKVGEYSRTMNRHNISKWFYLAALFGGPCALFGSYLAIGYVGPLFAAIAALMYPVVGATLARIWYQERISKRAAVGIFLILIGGMSVYAHGLLGEMGGFENGAWLGFLGGLMAAFGWGIEGAIAGRALDVSDPDVGIALRFSGEVFYWVCLIMPAFIMWSDYDVIGLMLATLSFWPMVWILLSGFCFGFCYVAWYKSFPLIGVGRGQAIGALYGVFAVIFLSIFTFTLPSWYFLIGLSLTIFGGVLMFTERSEMLEIIRRK